MTRREFRRPFNRTGEGRDEIREAPRFVYREMVFFFHETRHKYERLWAPGAGVVRAAVDMIGRRRGAGRGCEGRDVVGVERGLVYTARARSHKSRSEKPRSGFLRVTPFALQKKKNGKKKRLKTSSIHPYSFRRVSKRLRKCFTGSVRV